MYLHCCLYFVVVKQTLEPVTHMPPSTDLHHDPLVQTTSTSKCASWTKQEVKKWAEKNFTDIAEK